MKAFIPSAVLCVDVTIGQPLGDTPVPGTFTRARVLVRLDEVPVGYVEIPVSDGRISGARLGRCILERLEADLVAAVLAGRLNVGPLPAGPAPSLTVVVCTRNRADELAGCLDCLDALVGPRPEILVVDNAPDDQTAARLVEARGNGVRYVVEPTPGLSRARRTGVAEARGEVVAFIDDDVRVDRLWASAVASLFRQAGIAAVLGLVAPASLDTPAQQLFEWHGGFGRGFARRWIRRPAGRNAAPALANTGIYGTGANMAFRKAVFAEVGGFDVALGAGTLTEGGEDLDMIFRVIEAGHGLVYEPRALAWHIHRRSEAELVAQVASWGRGMSAYLAASRVRYPHERSGLLTLALQLSCLYHPRRVLQALVDPHLRVRLTLAEWAGALSGAARYRAARHSAGDPMATSRPRPSPPRARVSTAIPVIHVELGVPLPESLAVPEGSSRVTFVFHAGGTQAGTITLETGGLPVSRARLVDQMVAELDHRRLDPNESARLAIRSTLSGPG